MVYDCQLRAREESPVVRDFPLENDPRRPRQFIGERDHDNVRMRPCFETRDPPAQAVWPMTVMATDRARPMNKETAEIAIAAFRDPPQRDLPTSRILLGH